MRRVSLGAWAACRSVTRRSESTQSRRRLRADGSSGAASREVNRHGFPIYGWTLGAANERLGWKALPETAELGGWPLLSAAGREPLRSVSSDSPQLLGVGDSKAMCSSPEESHVCSLLKRRSHRQDGRQTRPASCADHATQTPAALAPGRRLYLKNC